jgi:hypothetical protein
MPRSSVIEMTPKLLSLLLLIVTQTSKAQFKVGENPATIQKSSILELESSRQGLLLPRLVDTAAINSLLPPNGMLIYLTADNSLRMRSAGAWKKIADISDAALNWSKAGNSGTNPATNFIGTTDSQPLAIRTNNIERMRLTADGFLGLGTTSPATLLHLSGTNPLTLMGVQLGSSTATDSVLTLTNGLVRKLPVADFQQAINGTGFVKASGTTLSYDNNAYTVANAAISSATKTKITYDSKGLVTGGADATTTDIAEGTRLYHTDARVRSTALTGFSAATATAVTATDNVLGGIGKLQGQINTINGAGYISGNQNITLSGDISGSGTTAITTAIGTNKVTLPHLAQVVTGSFLGRSTSGTGNVEALTTAQAKTLLGIAGTNSGDVALAGQNYLSLSGQTITANAIDLSGTHATGTLAAARFGALTGDVTNAAGSYATTIANGAVTYGKMQNISAANRLLGRATAGAGSAEEITIGSGLSLTGTTLSATGSGMWSTTGNSGTTWNNNFIGSTDNVGFRIRTNNTERMVIDSIGRVGIGGALSDAFSYVELKKSIATGLDSALLTLNSNNSGTNAGSTLQFKNAGSGYLGAVAGVDDGASNGRLEFRTNTTGLKTSPLNASETKMVIKSSGNVGIANTNPAEKLDVTGNMRFSGALMPGGAAGTAGQVLQSNGAGAAPTWVANGNSTAWVHGGNTLSAMQMFGTVSNFDLPFITNNTERMRLSATGNLGIGTLTPAEKLDVTGNIRLSGTAAKKLVFGNITADPDASIGLRATGATEQQEMLFYVGNDNNNGSGPDRIRMAAEEFRFQTFNNDAASTLANAEAGTGTKTRLLVNSEGNVAIGDSVFDATNPEKLLVNAGTATHNAIKGVGNINSYLQLNIQNNSAGTWASSDVVATANNGSETVNFVNMGINSGGYSELTMPVLGGANNAYLYSTGNDLVIGNAIANKNLRFFTGGTATTNERLRIDGNGNVGIGTTAPNSATKLDVSGSVKLGTSGTVVNNVISFEYLSTGNTSIGANTTIDFNVTLPTGTTISSTLRATITVSPGADLASGLIIGYARAISQTQVRIRISNTNSMMTTNIPNNTKFFFTVVDF